MTGYGTITAPTYRIEIPNTANVTGWGLANAWKTYSSIRYKENVATIPNALSKVLQLRGVEFDWKKANGGTHDIGFIAEELGKVLPEVVTYEKDGIYVQSVNYSAVIPVLTEALKEQHTTITTQQTEIRSLNERLAKLEAAIRQIGNGASGKLGMLDKNTAE